MVLNHHNNYLKLCAIYGVFFRTAHNAAFDEGNTVTKCDSNPGLPSCQTQVENLSSNTYRCVPVTSLDVIRF